MDQPTMFNEYGVPNEEVQEVERQIDAIVLPLFDRIVAAGVPLMELRAVAQYLESGIGVTASERILLRSMKLSKEKREAGG